MQSVRFDPDLIRRYDLHGPRYTSYPSALHFTGEFGEEEYRQAVAHSNDELIPRPLALYAHIPFCTSPCFYCGCTRIITRNPSKGAEYLDKLLEEIALVAPMLDRDRVVEQIHLGGGTPTFFSTGQLERLVQGFDQHFRMDHGTGREWSVEVDPRTLGPVEARELVSLGFNRFSLGVQDFDPAVQKAVNRVQSVEETVDLIDALRAAGVPSTNLDLIYGLPFQTPETFGRTLDTVLGIRPERLALYSYAHLPDLFKGQRQIHGEDLPAPEVKLELLQNSIERITSAGYVYIGMDHFALPDDELSLALADGTLQRNFQGYSTHAECDLLGFGMSAIGAIGDCYVQSAKSVIEYYHMIEKGRLPVYRGLSLSGDDLVRREIIQDIMCRGRIDGDRIARRWNIAFGEYFQTSLERLAALEADGLVTREGLHIQVTPAGRLLLRAVAMCFDGRREHGVQETPRYSRLI